MHRGLPTFLVIVILALGLGTFGWWMGNDHLQVGVAAAVPTATARPIPAAGWGPIRVMAANIRLDDPADGENGWLKRRELLVKTVLKYQPEIVACQEVSPIQGAYLNKELATWYSYFPRAGVAKAQEGGQTRSATAELLGALSQSLASLNTLYYRTDRFDILDGEGGLVLPNEPQANPTENTFFSLAILQEKRSATQDNAANPGTLIVVDIHFRHTEDFAIRCASKLREKIGTWEAKYPHSGILLLGDINRDRTTKLYATITGKEGAEKLGDTFDYNKMMSNRNWGTYHAFSGKSTQPWPTDLIFYGGSLDVSTPAEIIRDAGNEGKMPSDHFFVEAEVTFLGK